MEKEILKQLVQIAGSQKELATKSSIPQARISEWMNDVYTPKLSKLIYMAEKLGYEIHFNITQKSH